MLDPADAPRPATSSSEPDPPWLAPRPPIVSGEDYIASLRGRDLRVFLLGERVAEPVDHPILRPSINAVARTYDLALERPELATATVGATGERVNRFLHVTESVADVVQQNKMQRRLGQLTGTCFQRCVGMDAINALHTTTWLIDQAHGTPYHARLRAFVRAMQRQNLVVGGAMTDVKGDRGKGPSEQSDPDMFVRVVRREPGGVVIRGAKAHQTGCINSHWMVVMPTMRLGPRDRDYAIVCAVPVDHPGLTFVVGRQSCDTRALEGGAVDQGNARYGGQEALVVFDDVFVPEALIFMDGEAEFAADLVERFTAYHRRSYVCKAGVGDVLIGAAALIADYNGVPQVSHVRDKLVEMAHLNETIYGAGIAASHESTPTPAGNFQNDPLLANVCKHNVTRFPYELARLAQDLAGGLLATLPSEHDFNNPDVGPLLKKYLRGRDGASAEARARAATDREPDAGPQRRRLPDRVDARGRLAAGAADPDRAADAGRGQEGPGPRARGYRRRHLTTPPAWLHGPPHVRGPCHRERPAELRALARWNSQQRSFPG